MSFAKANDYQSANDIQRNMIVIRQCEQICLQQQNGLQQVQRLVNQPRVCHMRLQLSILYYLHCATAHEPD